MKSRTKSTAGITPLPSPRGTGENGPIGRRSALRTLGMAGVALFGDSPGVHRERGTGGNDRLLYGRQFVQGSEPGVPGRRERPGWRRR